MTLPVSVRIQEFLLLSVFSLALPTFDTYLDTYLAYNAFMAGNVYWGASLLAPVFMNMVCKTFTWWRMDSKQEKKWTWLLLIVQLWPQYKALQVFRTLVVKGEEKGLTDKKVYDRNIKVLEPFVEATPQV